MERKSMKQILILTGISSLFLSSSVLQASEPNCHIPGAKISLKIAKLQKKVDGYQDQIGRINHLRAKHSLEDERQLYTFLLSENEASKSNETGLKHLESDIELCRLGECYFRLVIGQDQQRMKELQTLYDDKYSNKKIERSLDEELNDLQLIRRKYTASDYSNSF